MTRVDVFTPASVDGGPNHTVEVDHGAGRTTLQSVPRKHHVGDEIDVIYDPQDPSGAILASRCEMMSENRCGYRYASTMGLVGSIAALFPTLIILGPRVWEGRWSKLAVRRA